MAARCFARHRAYSSASAASASTSAPIDASARGAVFHRRPPPQKGAATAGRLSVSFLFDRSARVAYKRHMEYEVSTIANFDSWLDGQSADVREMIATRIVRVEAGLLGDHATVGKGVSELRFHSGAGYRVYYTVRERVIVILLCGGTKRTQKREIKAAQELAAQV